MNEVYNGGFALKFGVSMLKETELCRGVIQNMFSNNFRQIPKKNVEDGAQF